MRIRATCEKCGASVEVHRFGVEAMLRFEHMCDSPEWAAVDSEKKGSFLARDIAPRDVRR